MSYSLQAERKENFEDALGGKVFMKAEIRSVRYLIQK